MFSLALLSFAIAPVADAQNAQPMTVGTPTVDANGVKYYPVRSVFEGWQLQTVRVLKPANPAAGMPPRLLFVLPVNAGVDTTSSPSSDGLEELRLLNVPDRYNMTLIAPSFNYVPWYGDDVNDPRFRMESFLVDDLVPWADQFAQGTIAQRYLIGFSKSGHGVLSLMFRHPGIFNAGAAWDSPAESSSLNDFSGLPQNFGTQANYSLYNIPSLVSTNAPPFVPQARLWISGDNATFTAQMNQLHSQFAAASIPNIWVTGATRAHTWNSGWLDGAAIGLFDMAVETAPNGNGIAPARSAGFPVGALAAGSTQATLTLKTDAAATCRYATTPGVTWAAMTGVFATTGSTAHSTSVTGLQDGGSYTYYVRCQDTASGLANTDDFAINFSVAANAGSTPGTATSSFGGTDSQLYENGMWTLAGSWNPLQKSDGAFAVGSTAAARMATPSTGANQFSEITYDQDPGSSSWVGVMTRIQGPSNGSGYVAIAYGGQLRLYRCDDSGNGLNFTPLASATASLATAPRDLRLESQGSTHRVYFNGVLVIRYNDSANTYSTGQPGIAGSTFGGPEVKILSFLGGVLTTSIGGANPPIRFGGQPTGTLVFGTSLTTLKLNTDENATCRYATSSGVSFAAMPTTFSTTGGTSQSTKVSGLQGGTTYTYYVRCQDSLGNPNLDDYPITFSIGAAGTGNNALSSNFAGVENPLFENGMWVTPGSWSPMQKNNGALPAGTTGGSMLMSPMVGPDEFGDITFDQDPGSGSWVGVMTRIQDAGDGGGYMAMAYNGQVRLYRADDNGGVSFTFLASAPATLATAPRDLRLESVGSTHRVYFNSALLISYTDPANTYSSGQAGIASAIFGGVTVRITSFKTGTFISPPARSAGQPSGSLPSGTTHATLSLTTNEAATCRYATTAGVAFSSMPNVFTTTGGTSHASTVTGLQDGSSYQYFVRCADAAGNANSDDYPISFSVTSATTGSGTASSNFAGAESPLSEGGMWSTSGSWAPFQKNNGAMVMYSSGAARLASPALSGDQFTDITFDQDPGSGTWIGVMTRMQGPTNGSGYLAIAFNGQVMLYRCDDNGGLNYSWLAGAYATLGTAPRELRLESKGSTHRVYFNGTLLITYTDTNNTYSTGQPGIAEAVFGGPTVRVLSFTGGNLQ